MTGPLEVGLLIQPVNPWDWERYEAGAFDQSPPVPDAKVWACCAVPLTRPITVSAFALTGMTYADGLTIPPTWGGPPNGFQFSNRGMDVGVLLAFTVALAACFVASTEWVTHRGPRG